MRTSGVPQTVDEARDYGWAWLTVRCMMCRRGGDQRFDALAGRESPVRLAALAARLVCKQCGGKRLLFELGMYVTGPASHGLGGVRLSSATALPFPRRGSEVCP